MENVDALPECSDANLGNLVLIDDLSTTTLCTSEGWSLSAVVLFSLFCQGSIDHASLPNGLSFAYRNVQVSVAGDTWASAVIANGAYQTSGSVLYSSQQQGATDGGVVLVDDYVGGANFGFWNFTVDVEAEELSIVYDDPDLPGAGSLTLTVPFDDEGCELQAY